MNIFAYFLFLILLYIQFKSNQEVLVDLKYSLFNLKDTPIPMFKQMCFVV